MIEKKLRKELIKSKSASIVKSLDFIEENLPQNIGEFLNSKLIRNAVYKEVEFAIELVIDICAIINSDLRFNIPEDDEDIINNIEKEKIFDKKTILIIREMKRFRNVLVHKYGDIDNKQAFESIKEGLKDFETIINDIEKFLKNN